jgi:cystathionine gamma-synthase
VSLDRHRPVTHANIHRYIYARVDNPTRRLLEQTMAKLEGGHESTVFGSGQAAAAAVLHSMPGGHLVIPDDIYHGIRTLVQTV